MSRSWKRVRGKANGAREGEGEREEGEEVTYLRGDDGILGQGVR